MAEIVSVIIPVYNEEAALSRVVEKTVKALSPKKSKFEVILVDDHSTDSSRGEAEKLAKKFSQVKVAGHDINLGYGASIKTGMRNSRGDIIVLIDADSTYDPADIPRVLDGMLEFDMVVGKRETDNIPFARKPAKFVLARLANYVTETSIPDLNSGLRAFRKKDVLPFLGITSNGFSFTTSITIAYLSKGLSIKYVPISYARRKGASKISPIRDFANFVILIVRTIAYFKPLKVFFPVSGLLFFLALLVYLSYFFTGVLYDTSVSILIVSGLQIALFGILADITVKNRR